jgi:hypothetical protein
MDSNLRVLMFAAAGAVAATVATDAMACEDCLPDPNSDTGEICWSGFDTGAGACWGGFGDPCQTSGYCEQTSDCWTGYCEEDAWDDYFCWGYGDCS